MIRLNKVFQHVQFELSKKMFKHQRSDVFFSFREIKEELEHRFWCIKCLTYGHLRYVFKTKIQIIDHFRNVHFMTSDLRRLDDQAFNICDFCFRIVKPKQYLCHHVPGDCQNEFWYSQKPKDQGESKVVSSNIKNKRNQ